MRRWSIAVLIWLTSTAASFAACPAVPTDCGNLTAKNITVGTSGTFGVSPNNILTITPGAASGNAVSFTRSGTGGFTFTGGQTVTGNASVGGTFTVTGPTTINNTLAARATTLTNQASTPTLTLSGNATTLSSSFLCGWVCVSGFFGGTVSGSDQAGVVNISMSDRLLSSSSQAPKMIEIDHFIAPNATTASGNRITLNILQHVIGDYAGGTYTTTGINQVAQFTSWASGNEGGTSAVPKGFHTAVSIDCSERTSNATFMIGCVNLEFDMAAVAGSSFDQNAQVLFVHTDDAAAVGRLGPDLGLVWGEQFGVTATGYKCIICLGTQARDTFPTQAQGAIIYAESNNGAARKLAVSIDTANVTFTGCSTRSPYLTECQVQGLSITGATRLTTDGAAASSFVYQAIRTYAGTSYTAVPVITVTGCTGAVVNGQLAGNSVGILGVNNPGSACAAEATISIAAQGGFAATGVLTIAGNTLNFPINSVVNVACTISGTDITHGGSSITAQHIQFVAAMGATASTTAIVGSPSWTTDGASGPNTLVMATPAADTTLGAIDLTTGAPSAGTWDVGGSCTMTKTTQS